MAANFGNKRTDLLGCQEDLGAKLEATSEGEQRDIAIRREIGRIRREN